MLCSQYPTTPKASTNLTSAELAQGSAAYRWDALQAVQPLDATWAGNLCSSD